MRFGLRTLYEPVATFTVCSDCTHRVVHRKAALADRIGSPALDRPEKVRSGWEISSENFSFSRAS